MNPYHIEVWSPLSSVQRLTFILFTSASPTRAPSNPPHNHQLDKLQPAIPTNPIRNTRVGQPFSLRPAPPQPSPNRTDPPPHQTRSSLNAPHGFQQSTPARPISEKAIKPKGITKNGLKQSMNLHNTKECRHAYNRFRVSSLVYLFSSTDSCCFRSAFGLP